MLATISVKNYRSCLATKFDCHGELSVLIGPNSSGKTNVLQAVMFLNKMAQQDVNVRFTREPATVNSAIRARFRDGAITVSLLATVEAYTDEANNDVLTAASQKWSIARPDGERATFELPLVFGAPLDEPTLFGERYTYSRQRRRLHDSVLREEVPDWARPVFARAAAFCAGIRYYSASQFTNPGACPVSFEIQREGELRRPVRLRGHARTLYDIYAAYKRPEEGSYDRFLEIVGPHGLRLIDRIKFREIPTSSLEYSVRVGGSIEARRKQKVLVIPQFKQARHLLSPNQLSEGTFKTIALLFYIITEQSTALLIEEPEVCVHHGLLSSILELIAVYSKQKQMIVSTHSDYVLDHVRPENVFSVTRHRSRGTEVRPIRRIMSQNDYAALRHYLDHEGNLGEYWREGGFEDTP